MRRLGLLMALAGAATLIPAWAATGVGPGSQGQKATLGDPPTRVRDTAAGSGPQTQPVAYEVPVYPPIGPYGPGGYAATPEVIGRIGEILAAVDSPQDRSKLAEQWLQYSKQVIARDQEFRNEWLELQRQQLRQQQHTQEYQLEIAQLQVRIQELRAQNLRLEQELLEAQRKLSQRAGAQASEAPTRAP